MFTKHRTDLMADQPIYFLFRKKEENVKNILPGLIAQEGAQHQTLRRGVSGDITLVLTFEFFSSF